MQSRARVRDIQLHHQQGFYFAVQRIVHERGRVIPGNAAAVKQIGLRHRLQKAYHSKYSVLFSGFISK
jgi:hypothetical protein